MSALRLKANAESGFSLTELMVVMGIIALVSSLGLSAYSKAQQQQRLAIATDKVRSSLELAKNMAISSNTAYELKLEGPSLAGNATVPPKVSVFSADGWQAGRPYVVGIVLNVNGYQYKCTQGGTSAATEPNWPTKANATVTDNTVTWTCESLANVSLAGFFLDRGLGISVAIPPATVGVNSGIVIFNADGTTNNTAGPYQLILNDDSAKPVMGVNVRCIYVYPGGMIKIMGYNGKNNTWY